MNKIDELKRKEDVPVVIADHHGVIIFVNHRFEEIFQWLNQEIVGKPITTIIPTHFHDAHHLGFSRFLTTEQSKILNQPIKLIAMKKNGEIFNAEHYIQAEKSNGAWFFAATIQPLEE